MTERLTTTQMAVRYNISTKLFDQWRRYSGFPAEAAIREGTSLLWDHTRVDEWLRSRRVSSNGPTPRWLKIVDHPAMAPQA